MIKFLMSFVLLSASFSFARPAIFCRDCPFPAKIADGRWVMPNGRLQVDIDELARPGYMNEVRVTLRDASTGTFIASGKVIQRRDRKTMEIDLFDRKGHPIKGLVRYVDPDHGTIQASFSCETCSAGAMLQ